MGAAVAGGADGVVSHRGSAARCMPVQRETALVVHLSGGTALSPQSELKTQVCTPEAALAPGGRRPVRPCHAGRRLGRGLGRAGRPAARSPLTATGWAYRCW
ncbi:hypothetical protein ACRAWF_06685 [Streptomyces sp. L7]